MALDPSAEYPGQIETGDPGYPLGKAQNVTVEGDGTGTPLEKALVNDLFGFQQALLAAAGITPSGNPDMVGASDYLLAIYRLGRWAPGWGAVGNGVADDTLALQAGITAVAALGPGLQEFHLWPGATYRHTGLSVPANVSIFFHGATLQIDHATNNGLTYASTTGTDNGSLRQRIVGGRFTANVANAGAAIRVTGGAGLDVEQCYFGASTNCNGKCVDTTGASSNVRLVDCTFHGRASTTLVDFGSGYLEVVRCKHVVPATYATSCVKIGAATAWIDSSRFDLVTHTSGALVCIEVSSALAVVHVDDSVFVRSTDPSSAYAIKWAVAAKIIERGSSYSGNIIAYNSAAVLAEGSWLDMRPHGVFDTTDETYTVPDDYRSISLEAGWGSVPTITLPTIHYPGQELELRIYQGSPTALPTLAMNALGPNAGPLAGGKIRTGRLKAMWDSFLDRWYWVVIGTWSPDIDRAVDLT